MTRRRTAAGLTALAAITAALVLSGSVAANADDGLEFDAAFDGATIAYADRDVAFSGTAAALPGSVDVWLDGEFLICTAPVAAGAWACPAPTALPIGSSTYIAIQDFGLPSEIQDQVTVTVALPTPTVTGPAAVPAAGTIQLTGGGGAQDATITAVVTTPAVPALTCSTGPLPADGPWACDIPFDAELDPATTATVTVTQSHPDAVASTQTTHDVQIGATPPAAIELTTPANDLYVTWEPGNFLTVNGRAPLGDPVTVEIDGVVYEPCTGLTVDVGGNWDCGNIFIDPGHHTVTARQLGDTDSADINVGVPGPEMAGLPLVVDVDSPSYPLHTVGGNGLVGYAVTATLYDGVLVIDACTSPVSPGGTWECDLDLGTTEPGYYELRAQQTPVPADPDVDSEVDSYAFQIGTPPAALPPPMNCAFGPASVTLSSPHQVIKSVYRLTPFSGGGSSGGGSGGSGEEGYELADQGYCSGDDGYHDPSVTVWDDGGAPVPGGSCGTATCTLSDLEPGIYEVYHWLSDGDESSEGLGYSYEEFDYLFRVPGTPALTTVASTTNSVVLRGSATAGDQVRVERANGTGLCTTTATGAGQWVCQFPKSSASSARVIATDPQSGGMSAYSPARSIPVFVPATPAAEPLPTLVAWFLEFGGDLGNLKPGDSFTLTVSGMPEGTEIEVWMHSTPRLLGTATGTGAPMQLQLTVPEDIESGQHEIEMVAVTPLGTNYFFTSDATVVGGAAPAEEPLVEPAGEEGAGAGGGGAAADRSDPAAPSALTGSIAPLAQIAANPATVAIAGGLALALLFLVALPTELLNSSLSSNTSRLGRGYGAIDDAMTRAQNWLIRVTRSRAIAAGILVVVVAVIYGFVDPGFGFDIVSLRLVLSLAIAFFVLSFVASWISGLIIRRAWGAMGVVAMQPSIILFAVVGVVVARILEFSPGFLVGVAIGLELLQASKTVAARAVFVQLGVVTGLALAAWVVYSLFTPGDDFAGMLVEDTLVAVTAEGLTGALIAVFPLKFLDGRELWEVSKRLWVLAFLIVSTAFALLVLPTAVEGTDVADYGTWLVVFAVFGLVSLLVWLIFVRADRKAAEAERERVDA